jgi:hypothetical protein
VPNLAIAEQTKVLWTVTQTWKDAEPRANSSIAAA